MTTIQINSFGIVHSYLKRLPSVILDMMQIERNLRERRDMAGVYQGLKKIMRHGQNIGLPARGSFIQESVKTIELYEKQNYGQTAIYATGPLAEPIARLTGRKTLTRADIQALQDLGFDFDWVLNPQTNRAFYAGRRAA